MRHNYENNPPVGIDFGTSNSAIAYYVNSKRVQGSQVFYHNDQDSHLIASSVYLEEDDESSIFLVGKAAENKWKNNPTKYANAIKRKIGSENEVFQLGNKTYTPIELASEVFKAVFKDPMEQTEDFFPSGIVVSVPYYYKQSQNDHTLLAINKALSKIYENSTKKELPKVLGLVPEPIAAALYYINNLESSNTINEQKILLFDLGGGTLDITMFKVAVEAQKLHFEVLASDGHANFGGEDFDALLIDYVMDEESIDLNGLSKKEEYRSAKSIKDAVKEAKEILSFSKEAHLMVGNLPNGKSIDLKIKRTIFEQILSGNNKQQRNFGKELQTVLSSSLFKSNVKKEDVNVILLIGSSSQIPYFQNLLKIYFKNAILEVNQDFLKYAVSKGAALYAAYLLDKTHGHNHQAFGKGISYEDSKIVFRTSHDFGIEKQKGQMSVIIPANAIVPAKNSKLFIPTAYTDASQQFVKLDAIKICQGNSNDKKSISYLGFSKKLPPIYTHGRDLETIKIKIDFEAKETTLSAHITIPKSDKNGKDISEQTSISTVSS